MREFDEYVVIYITNSENKRVKENYRGRREAYMERVSEVYMEREGERYICRERVRGIYGERG